MIGLAIFPLAIYFFFLAFLTGGRRPKVLNGAKDFSLLASGLFGLLTLGPGRMLAPIEVLGFWGWKTWIFWAAFYFVVVYLIAERLRSRIVVYHCALSRMLPEFRDWGTQLDPQFRMTGNVMHLPGLGVQCSFLGNVLGGCVVFQGTAPFQNRVGWQLFERELNDLCRTLGETSDKTSKKWAFLWGIVGLVLFSAACANLFLHFSELVELSKDYWG